MIFGKHFHRKEAPWEVVDCHAVTPISMWDDIEELEVVRMHDADMSFKIEHDIQRSTDLQKVLQVARYHLMEQAFQHNFNVLLVEGWRLTLMRKGKKYRVEVVYTGRPAYAMGKDTRVPAPPFLCFLEQCQRELHQLLPSE
ncbi:hypothetical protein PHLCEN_2v12808 [Hermanssonia centrifuga]|uniref:Uncharacterized protein n=1 Tax=Hermanssonia centrifuga TaxID=98765 RepID=A0A2R6NFY6_9APHY|nr:hypothetical protein PHLCEN_2v12808 [Hermanssonia centrifuga]